MGLTFHLSRILRAYDVFQIFKEPLFTYNSFQQYYTEIFFFF